MSKIGGSTTYLSNQNGMVGYKNYLAQGLPISIGAEGSAFGHLVKVRMEQSGSCAVVHSVMDLCAVVQNKLKGTKENLPGVKARDFAKA